MLIKTEKAIIKPKEKEIFELIDREPALPEKVRLATKLRRKIWQMLQLQR
jgi:hypothetical protein